jgi:hypothetical protein
MARTVVADQAEDARGSARDLPAQAELCRADREILGAWPNWE